MIDSTSQQTPATRTEDRDEKRARLELARSEREKVRKDKLADRVIERLELAERFEQEVGPEGSEFSIYDSGQVDDPLVVVVRPLLVQWTKYEQSKQTPEDRFDFVTPSVKHPPREEYIALRNKRIGVELGASNLMAKMMGLQADADAGK